MDAITIFIASAKDLNPMDDDTTWYGIIKDIIEVDYYDFQYVVFYCDWVNIADKPHGCKICPDSNLLMVNPNKLKSSNGEYDVSIILTSEESQIFYIKDIQNPDWFIVRRSPKRLTNDTDDYVMMTNFPSDLNEQHNLTLLKYMEFL